MPKIIFIEPDGMQTTTEADSGTPIMRAAVAAGIDGIVAECGGNAMCATCHVYIDDDGALPPLDEVEDELLDATSAERRATSRLSCQIPITDEMDGLMIELPETQE